MSILEALQNNGFATIDYIVIAAYLVLLVSLGWWVSRGKKGKEKSANDYFLAGNTLTWWAVGASLIAANISAEQFIGMSGSAYRSGIAMAAYELQAALTLLLVGKFLLPLMLKKKIFTIPQFLSDRYNEGTGLAFSIFWLFLYVFINLTSVSWLGALAIKHILGLPAVPAMFLGMEVDMTMVSIILILFLIAGLYSIYGGLASVAWTDVLQVVFLVGGGLITVFATLHFVAEHLGVEGGAFGALGHIYRELSANPDWVPADKHFNLIVTRSSDIYPSITDDPYFDIPGVVVLVGALWLSNIGYWGFNQYIIQKGLAARSLDDAQKGMIFAGALKLLIPFIVCIPGVCAYYIMNAPECESIRASLSGAIMRSDDAYPFLIHNFTPTVVKGLAFAALAAAVISSLASMFNSTSTIFTMDIYKKFLNKEASQQRLVRVGRITSLCALLIALVAVYPIMGGADQAFQVIQEYSGFVFPGLVIIFGLGLLWKRSSGTAAVVTAIGTFVFSIAFKFLMPETPFLQRMGYVFFCLLALFIPISMADKHVKEAEKLSPETTNWQLTASRIFYVLAILSAVVGIVMMQFEVGRNLGFEAIFFFAVAMAGLGWTAHSNAKDQCENIKSIGVDVEAFHTSRAFNIGAITIVALFILLYIFLW